MRRKAVFSWHAMVMIAFMFGCRSPSIDPNTATEDSRSRNLGSSAPRSGANRGSSFSAAATYNRGNTNLMGCPLIVTTPPRSSAASSVVEPPGSCRPGGMGGPPAAGGPIIVAPINNPPSLSPAPGSPRMPRLMPPPVVPRPTAFKLPVLLDGIRLITRTRTRHVPHPSAIRQQVGIRRLSRTGRVFRPLLQLLQSATERPHPIRAAYTQRTASGMPLPPLLHRPMR